MKLRNICVYCGSSMGRDPAFAAGARALAAALLQRGIGLVYGGASVGLMGVLADAMLANGGRVIGVIPQALLDKEVGHAGLTELHVTHSMHERKARMAELADGFIALPGGIGTLEEVFEIWTWAQLGFHAKPCGLLDRGGYYAKLCAFLDQATAQGFIRPACRDMLMLEQEAGKLLDRFERHAPPPQPRWVEKHQT